MDPVCSLFKDRNLIAYIKTSAILMTSFINYFSNSHQSFTHKSLSINFLVSQLVFLQFYLPRPEFVNSLKFMLMREILSHPLEF